MTNTKITEVPAKQKQGQERTIASAKKTTFITSRTLAI
jgi:hypothetical protein